MSVLQVGRSSLAAAVLVGLVALHAACGSDDEAASDASADAGTAPDVEVPDGASPTFDAAGPVADGGPPPDAATTSPLAQPRLSAGGFACALTSADALRCWGAYHDSPVAIDAPSTYLRSSVGLAHACGIRQGGGLVCWDSTFAPNEQDAGGLRDVAASGTTNVCVIAASGALLCKGTKNTHGQLGVGDFDPRPELTQVGSATDWGRVSASANHACAIKSGGELFCWGINNVYQLGDDTQTTRPAPTEVASQLRWVDISTGGGVTCGVTTTGELRCFGAYLGGGHTPKVIGTSSDWARVSVDIEQGNLACALSKTGELYCWGTSMVGGLGLGPVTSAATPTRVGTDSDWIDVAVGNGFACGTRASGQTYCWGANNAGQLGNGGGGPSAVPVPTQ